MSQQQLVQLFSGGLGGLTNSGLLSSRSGPRESSRNRNDSAVASSGETAGNSDASPTLAQRSTTGESSTPASKQKSPPSDDASGASGNVPIQLMDLQSVLSGIKVPSASKEPSIDLSTGITGEVIKPLLNNPDFVQKMKDLLPQSEEEDAENDITSTISSPQFKQALHLFSTGLQSGQLAPLIREFDLGDAAVAAASSGNMEDFVKAIQVGKGDKEGETSSEKSDDPPKEDDKDKKDKLDDLPLD